MLAMLLSLAASAASAAPRPIALHPTNPRYFIYAGRPTVLITSGEHYGAVLNSDFDFVPYLDELQARGLNLTRTFTGVYMEDAGSFKIRNNTLAPGEARLICPWARSAEPGYAKGGNRFDLSRWDEAYFARLKTFCSEAGKRGVVVELALFCPYYEDRMWQISRLHPANNVNGTPNVPRTEVLTLKHPELLAIQDAMARKIVSELRDVPNLYYELCNEPYFGGVTLEWQAHIADVIAEAEAGLLHKHLIAQNIANGSAEVTNPNPLVSLFNFHYANPPEAVKANWGLNRPIALDETGFKGSDDPPYRTDAWEFMLAGGAVYDNLDYSFTCEHPNGTAEISAPGGGGPQLRAQLAALKRFIEGFEFVRMAPDAEVIAGGVPDGAVARCLAEPGKQYAVYVKGGTQADLLLDVPPGKWRIEWLKPGSGESEGASVVEHVGGELTAKSPAYVEDIALSLRRAG
jgi:hypothetical protein